MKSLLTLQHPAAAVTAGARRAHADSGSSSSRSTASTAQVGGAAAAGEHLVTLLPVNILLKTKSEYSDPLFTERPPGDLTLSIDSHFTYPQPDDAAADAPPFVRVWGHFFAWHRFERKGGVKYPGRAPEEARPEVELTIQLQAGVLG